MIAYSSTRAKTQQRLAEVSQDFQEMARSSHSCSLRLANTVMFTVRQTSPDPKQYLIQNPVRRETQLH